MTVAYRDRAALEQIDLTLEFGQLVGLVGPNGAGKSTLLKTLLGLVEPRRGSAKVLGQRPAAARRRVAYVPQRERVEWDFPISVEQVVLMGSYRRVGWLRRPGAAERNAAFDALARVGMADRLRDQIGRLSGGQQQRVFLARALLQIGHGAGLAGGDEPGLVLLDEPLTGVDATTQQAVLRLLRELAERGHAVVVATHDLTAARAACDRLLLLNRVICADGCPAEVLTPERLRAAYGGQLVLA